MKVHNPARIRRFIPSPVERFAREFAAEGFELFLVGGAVRNILTDRPPQDFDFATNARPAEVKQLFRRVLPTGIEHGTVTVLYSGEQFEVTTYRAESTYSDNRHPDDVAFVQSIEEDLSRRDFTFNALAYDPVRDLFLDPHYGVNDLREDTVRAIGDPNERFAEDALRILRAVRFASQLQFSIESGTFAAIVEHAETVSAVAVERVQSELNKLLLSPSASHGLHLLKKAGLLQFIIPELAQTVGFEQGGRHRFTLFAHLARTCDATPAELHLRLAGLLHDVGKPAAVTRSDGEILNYHNHDTIGAAISEEILRRLRYPNRIVSLVSHLVRHHMFGYSPEWSDAAIRRLISRVGAEAIPDLLALRLADSRAVTGLAPDTRLVSELSDRVQEQLNRKSALTTADLAVNGNDLIEAGIPAGPLLGVVLRQLLETVIDDPKQNERELLIRIARTIYEQISGSD